jgi:hypothetical protein
MWLLLTHPEMIDRTCEQCERYVYNDTSDYLSPEKIVDKRTSLPLLRPEGSKLPCGKCPRTEFAKTRTKANALHITDKTFKTINHYRKCKAVNHFPKDEIVITNASILRAVEDEIERDDRRTMNMLLKVLARRIGS